MLYVATGDKGQIYSVTPDGKGELFYASDEAHIRVLAFDGKGNSNCGDRAKRTSTAPDARQRRERSQKDLCCTKRRSVR